MRISHLILPILLLSCSGSKSGEESSTSDSTVVVKPIHADSSALQKVAEQTVAADTATSQGEMEYQEDTDPVDSAGNPIEFNKELVTPQPTEPQEEREKLQQGRGDPIAEQYYSANIDGKAVTITLREYMRRITGVYYPVGSSDVLYQIDGRISADKVYTWDEFVLEDGVKKQVASVVAKLDTTDIAGTRYNADKSQSAPLRARRLGPDKTKISYNTVFVIRDNEFYLKSVELTDRRGFYQTFEFQDLANTNLKLLSLDIDFDRRQEYYLLCTEFNNCGVHVWQWSERDKGYVAITAPEDFADPTVDYGNKRILVKVAIPGGDQYYLDTYALKNNALQRTDRATYSVKTGRRSN